MMEGCDITQPVDNSEENILRAALTSDSPRSLSREG